MWRICIVAGSGAENRYHPLKFSVHPGIPAWMDTTMLHIRKSLLYRETLASELGKVAARPVVRTLAMAVIRNPYAGRFVEDLTELFETGRAIGEQFMPELVALLRQAPVSYGKGAIVGINGEFEHGGACIHPMLGKPMRSAAARR
jgi:hypothetical protein